MSKKMLYIKKYKGSERMTLDKYYEAVNDIIEDCLTIEELCETYAEMYVHLKRQMVFKADSLEIKDD